LRSLLRYRQRADLTVLFQYYRPRDGNQVSRCLAAPHPPRCDVSQPASNGTAAGPTHPVAAFIAELASQGVDRNTIFLDAVKLNNACPESLPDDELLPLIQAALMPAELQKPPEEW
jgi:hypothetical protein